jgi:pimeloyl-ACP methyl ester carboxylesterase
MAANWFTLSPLLANEGFSVFALDYGCYGHGVLTRRSCGVGDAAASAAELDAFVDRVLAATRAQQVDLVGHSFGALLGQYYVKRVGIGKVGHIVGLGPTWNGTTFNGVLRVPAFRRASAWLMGENILQQAAGSPFLRELYADGPTAPGVRYTTISPHWDEFTTPVKAQAIQAPGVTNIRLTNFTEHLLLAFNRRALSHVVRALEGFAVGSL